jgi:hypothetical protein
MIVTTDNGTSRQMASASGALIVPFLSNLDLQINQTSGTTQPIKTVAFRIA